MDHKFCRILPHPLCAIFSGKMSIPTYDSGLFPLLIQGSTGLRVWPWTG